jgi:hypothetical protein
MQRRAGVFGMGLGCQRCRMKGALIERVLSAVSVCIITATISVFSDRLPVPTAETYRQQPAAQVVALAVVTIQSIVADARAMVTSYIRGNPFMLMYALGSLALMLLMLRS